MAGGGGSSAKASRYYAGWHMVPCLYAHEVVLETMQVNDLNVYHGNVAPGETFIVNEQEIFGGLEKEGGVYGFFEFQDGNEDQLPSTYLQEVLGEDQTPAYRGMVSVIARQPYLQANNPYLFPYKFKILSFHGDWQLDLRVLSTLVVTYTEEDATPTDNVDIDPEERSCRLSVWEQGQCEIRNYPDPDSFPNGAAVDDPASWICSETTDIGLEEICSEYRFVGSGYGPPPSPDVTVTESSELKVMGTNGAHIVREVLINKDWGLGLDSDEYIEDADFVVAAQTLWDEGLAISLSWDLQTSVEKFLQVIMDHIGGILSQTPGTKKYTLTLIRDGQTPQLSILEKNILSFDEYEEKGWAGVTNELTVKYTDVIDGKGKSVTVHDLAAIERQGGIIPETRDYPGIPSLELAEKIARRDLATITSAGSKIQITTDRIAYNLVVGRNFELTWPEYGLDRAIFRAVDIDYGQQDRNEIRISAISDAPVSTIFQEPSAVEDNPPTQGPFTDPINANPRAVYEAPYWHVAKSMATTGFPEMPGDIDSFLIALGGRTQSVARHFATLFQNGADEILAGSTGGWSGSVITLFSLNEQEVDISLDRTYSNNLEKFVPGALAVLGRTEIVEIVDFDLDSWHLTINRGMLDTVPVEHLGTSTINTIDYDQVAFSYETWLPGDVCTAWLRTVTNTGILPIEDTATFSLPIVGRRQARPLPVGNLQVGGEYLGVVFMGALTISWANRNRLTQTTDDHVTQSDSSVVPEPGTEFNILIYGNEDTLLREVNLPPTIVEDPSTQIDLYEHDSAASVTGTWPKNLTTDSTDDHTGVGFSTTQSYASAFETKLAGTFKFTGSRYNVYPTYLGIAPTGFSREISYGSPETIIGMGFGDNTVSNYDTYKVATDIGGTVGSVIPGPLQAGITYSFELVFNWLDNTVTMSLGGVVRVSAAAIPAGHQGIKDSFVVVAHFPNFSSNGTVIFDDIRLTSDGVEEFYYAEPVSEAGYSYPTSYTYPVEDEIADTGTGELNDRLRFVLTTVRDDLPSWTSWEHVCYRAASTAAVIIDNPNFSTGDLTGWEVIYGEVVARPVAGMPFGVDPACEESDFVMGNRAGDEIGPWAVSQTINLALYTSSDALDNGLTVLKFEMMQQAITYGAIGEFKVDYYDAQGAYLDTEVGAHFYFQVGAWRRIEFYSDNFPGAYFAKLTISAISEGSLNDGYVGCVKATIYGKLGESVNVTAATPYAAVSSRFVDGASSAITAISAYAAVESRLVQDADTYLTALSPYAAVEGRLVEDADTRLTALCANAATWGAGPAKVVATNVSAIQASAPINVAATNVSAIQASAPINVAAVNLTAIVQI